MSEELIKFEDIKAINYWEESPKSQGLWRASYLDEIQGFIGTRLLKVLVGQRRSGKSSILKQTITSLLAQSVNPKNILYLNFELHTLHFIRSHEVLADVVTMYLQKNKPEGRIYLFFDEIQEVEEWELLINSYLANDKMDVEIFLTGSNAHLLSTELSTYVTGRYIEIPIFPFSFKEFNQYFQYTGTKENLIEYLQTSSLPELFSLPEERQKIAYLMALQDSILMNDIVKRYQVKNPNLLALLLDFMIDNVGHLFSLNAIVNKIKSMGIHLNAITLGNYITYLERTFLVHPVQRYDIKGKRILEGERKYYLNDLGFSNYLKSSFDNGINRKLENYVYQTLAQFKFKIYVGYIHHLEIDFVAQMNQRIIYIQVAYLLHSQEVIDREYGNLEKIKDNWPKMVVTLDEVSFPEKNGIQHVPAWKLEDYLSAFLIS